MLYLKSDDIQKLKPAKSVCKSLRKITYIKRNQLNMYDTDAIQNVKKSVPVIFS